VAPTEPTVDDDGVARCHRRGERVDHEQDLHCPERYKTVASTRVTSLSSNWVRT
jgi:hypothetical protein